jgi:hypothetical protein
MIHYHFLNKYIETAVIITFAFILSVIIQIIFNYYGIIFDLMQFIMLFIAMLFLSIGGIKGYMDLYHKNR